jgi:hypothetical protein
LKKSGDAAAADPTIEATFKAAYLFISLLIGFIAGILAGLAFNLSNLTMINPSDPKILLGIAGAGYAGTDFIEGVFQNLIPGAATPGPNGKESGNESISGGGPDRSRGGPDKSGGGPGTTGGGGSPGTAEAASRNGVKSESSAVNPNAIASLLAGDKIGAGAK